MTKSLYPAPVIVATFAQGEEIRMSFWQPARAGGPVWRYHEAVGMVKAVIADERARASWNGCGLAPLGVGEADDLLSAHIEWDGQIIDAATAKAKVSCLRDRIIANLRTLPWADLEAIQGAIDQRLAA